MPRRRKSSRASPRAASPPGGEPAPAAEALRPFGWANLLLDIPAGYHLASIEGDGRRGGLKLADPRRPRLEMSWATVTRRRFDALAFATRKLERSRGKGAAATQDAIRAVEHPAYDPLLRRRDPSAALDRFVGYCPATRRLLELAYHHGRPAEDRLFRTTVLPSLRDQPRDAPARWAFFDVSFVAPAGFTYHSAQLNLGDMRVRLIAGRRETGGPTLTVRQVYPAGLALARQPLERWADAWLREGQRPDYLPRRAGLLRRRPAATAPISTPRGPGVAAAASLRWARRALQWRMPLAMRVWMIHDKEAERLLGVRATDRPERVDRWLDEILAGTHWAGMPG